MSVGSLYIHQVGLACPVGLTAAAACAAMRAGIDRRRELPYVDNDGEPIVGSALSQISFESSALDRCAHLLALALLDLARGQSDGVLEGLPLVVAVPPSLEARWGAAALMERALQLTESALRPRSVHPVVGGAAAGLQCFAEARLLLAAGHPGCVVCAVDSLVNAGRLLELSQGRRLLSSQNSDGVTPGEAAASVLLSLQTRGAKAVVAGLGFGLETATLYVDEPLRGDGIVRATRAALSQAGRTLYDTDFRVSDAAGEGYFFKEQVLLMSRLLRKVKRHYPVWLCAETLGLVGTAAGLCGLVRAVVGFEKGTTPGPRAVVFAGDPQGARAAILLDAVEG